MNSLGKVIEIILMAIFICVLPVYYMALKQDSICQTYVTTETSYFVDSIRNQGYLTKDMYQLYQKRLQATGLLYSVYMIHYKAELSQIEEGGKIIYKKYYHTITTKEILKEKSYYFTRGDYFKIEIYNQSKTYATKLGELFYGRKLPIEQIAVTYGGMIRDEVY